MATAVGPAQFVGRAHELGLLEEALREACSGHGGAALIAGEAGIGKTRIALEAAAAAGRYGFRVAGARSYERRWGPPFSAWIDALANVAAGELLETVAGRPPEHLAVLRELGVDIGGTGGADAPPLAPEEARLRAGDLLARLIVDLSEKQPLALLLDDLHWADVASLELLAYFARFLAGNRLFLLGVYRDELPLDHRCLASFAELDRHAPVVRITLGPLAPDETHELVEQLAGREVPRPVAEAIHAETDGHPFFVGELVQHVLERGDDFAEMPPPLLPEGIRQAIGARLRGLEAETRRVLAVAAAFTHPFDFPVLRALTGVDDERLAGALDEAVRARMLRPAGGELHEFAHALVRRALYDELSPARRARLHRRIAQALEQIHAGRELEHAGELAAQYEASSALPGAEHGIRYAVAAAEQAALGHGHEQAVSLLRSARSLATSAALSLRADVACRLAIAEADALMLADAERTTTEALALLEQERADPDRLADFIATVARRLANARTLTRRLGDTEGRDDCVPSLVDRGLSLLGNRRDLRWARLRLLERPVERVDAGPVRAGRWLGFDPEAVAIARSEGNEQDFGRTLTAQEPRSREELDELLARVDTWRDPAARTRALDVVAQTLAFQHGDMRSARGVVSRLLDYAEHTGSLPTQAYALGWRAGIEATLGELAAARSDLAHATELRARLAGSDPAHSPRAFAEQVSSEYTVDHWRGVDWDVIARVLLAYALGPGRPAVMALLYAAMAAEALARAGDTAQAGEVLTWIVPAIERSPPRTLHQNAAACFAGSAAWELVAAEHAAALRRAILRVIEAAIGDGWWTSNELAAGRMASLLGEASEAARYFALARARLEETGRRPLRAVVDYDEALHRHRHGLPQAGLPLAAARERFSELGMTEWIERADRLAAAVREVLPDGLTQREGEVLRLLADGRSNAAIAEMLVISVHTVERHLANVYRKIGARNRADAAAYAVRAQL